MSLSFQGREKHPLGKTETAWKSTGKAKNKWTVAIIESRSYNFGRAGHVEEWSTVGNCYRKSNCCPLSWHCIFALAIFYLAWGASVTSCPSYIQPTSSSEILSVSIEKEPVIARLQGWAWPPAERSFAPFLCTWRGWGNRPSHLRHDYPSSLGAQASRSSLFYSLKKRASIPMRNGTIQKPGLNFSCPYFN